MNFKLHSEFAPTGDQPTAIEKLSEGLQNGEKYQTLLGVTGSGKTFTIANVVEKSFLEVQRLRLGKTRNRTCNHETLVSEKSRNHVSGVSKNVQN